MKISAVSKNNRRKAFNITVDDRILAFPYALLRIRPDTANRIKTVFVDEELGNEAFTYVLENDDQDTIHLDEVLEYNKDPRYLHELMLYDLTLKAQECLGKSGLSKREIIRRLHTSPSQLYRLLDQTNYAKSVDQMLVLLNVLNCAVKFSIQPPTQPVQRRTKSNTAISRRKVT